MRILKFRRSRIFRGNGITVMHADKHGKPVLVKDGSWRNICGVFINLRESGYLIEFRNYSYIPTTKYPTLLFQWGSCREK